MSDIRVFELVAAFSEALLALLTGKGHLLALLQGMLLRLAMAFCAVEPLSATWGADGNLSIEDVFAGSVVLVSGSLPGAYDAHHIMQRA